MKTALINLAHRVAKRDIVAIYTMAVIDIALVTIAVGIAAYLCI